MIRKTIEHDEEFLRQVSTPVDFENDNYMEYINSCREYCSQNNCYAISPVQVGIPKRIIYIKNTSQNMDTNFIDGYDESVVYINPVITKMTGKTLFNEACESCLFIRDGVKVYYAGLVNRPYKIEVEYYDIKGIKKSKEIEGFEATIFCHEYDHLNGILHMDKSLQIFEMTPDEIREYRTHHPYEIISQDGDFE